MLLIEAPDVHVDQGDSVLVIVPLIVLYDGILIGHSFIGDDVTSLGVSQVEGEGLSSYHFIILGRSPAQQGQDAGPLRWLTIWDWISWHTGPL